MALCREQGFAFFLAQQTVLRGWAVAEQGQVEEGMAQMRQSIAAYKEVFGLQAPGAEGERPYLLALLAEAYGKVEQTQEGLRVLDEALIAAQKGEVAGIAGRNKSEPPVAVAGQAHRGIRPAGAHLRLVHRGL